MFCSALEDALEHHFNNHSQCQELWCIFLQKNVSMERKNAKHEQLQDKVKDKALYDAIKAIHDMFLTDKNIKMLNHCHDSQKMKP